MIRRWATHCMATAFHRVFTWRWTIVFAPTFLLLAGAALALIVWIEIQLAQWGASQSLDFHGEWQLITPISLTLSLTLTAILAAAFSTVVSSLWSWAHYEHAERLESDHTLSVYFENGWTCSAIVGTGDDQRGVVLKANDAFCLLLNSPPESVVGRRLEALAPPTQGYILLRAIQTTLDTGHAACLAKLSCGNGRVAALEVEMFLSNSTSDHHLLIHARQAYTDPNNFEENLRARQIVDNCSDGIAFLDLQGSCLYANPAACRLTGWSTEEIRGKRLFDAHSSLPNSPWHEIAESLRLGVCRSFETVAKRKQGGTLDVEIRLVRVSEDQSSLLLACFHDIGERKQFLEQNRISRERMQMALAGANLGWWEYDLGRSHMESSDRCYEITGHEQQQLTNKNEGWKSLIHPQDTHRFDASLDATTKGLTPHFSSTVRLWHRSGKWIWVSCRGRVTRRNLEGLPLVICGTMHDVSESKDLEDALQASESLFRSLALSSGEILVLLNSDGKVSFWNQSATRILGYPMEDMLDLPITDILRDTEGNPLGILDNPALLFSQPPGKPLELSCSAIHKNCSTVTLEASLSWLDYHFGRSLVLVARDVSEQRRLEQEFLSLTESEQRRMGHELHDTVCQDLAALARAAEVSMLRHKSLDPSVRHDLEKIHATGLASLRSARSLAHGLSLMEKDIASLEKSLVQLVENVSSLTGVQCSISCQPSISHPNSEVFAQLYRIAKEAVNNALRHSCCESIHISLSVQTGAICMEITNDGNIYKVPAQTDNSGLGLKLMNYRARSIGGTYRIQPGQSSGATVSVRIPGAGRQEDYQEKQTA